MAAASGNADDALLQEILSRFVRRPLDTEGAPSHSDEDELGDLYAPWHAEEDVLLFWEWMTRLRPSGGATRAEILEMLRTEDDCIGNAAYVSHAYRVMEGKVDVLDTVSELTGFYFMCKGEVALLGSFYEPGKDRVWAVTFDPEGAPAPWRDPSQVGIYHGIEELSAWVDTIRDPMVKSAAKD
jgi:hypothetical protein